MDPISDKEGIDLELEFRESASKLLQQLKTKSFEGTGTLIKADIKTRKNGGGAEVESKKKMMHQGSKESEVNGKERGRRYKKIPALSNSIEVIDEKKPTRRRKSALVNNPNKLYKDETANNKKRKLVEGKNEKVPKGKRRRGSIKKGAKSNRQANNANRTSTRKVSRKVPKA